ncbi:MAG: hypothetical protein M5U01_30770 [Ardenticatenaceae bacterium]|nr:hypothetical protein [Ardenticatenaceae bacterium]
MQRRLDFHRSGDGHRAGRLVGDEERELIHRQDRHPVRAARTQAEATVEPAHLVGQGATAGNDQHTHGRPAHRQQLQQLPKRRIDQETAAELDDQAGIGDWRLAIGD